MAQRARARVTSGRLAREGDEGHAVGVREEEVVRVLAEEGQQAEVGVHDDLEPLGTRRVQLVGQLRDLDVVIVLESEGEGTVRCRSRSKPT